MTELFTDITNLEKILASSYIDLVFNKYNSVPKLINAVEQFRKVCRLET